MKASSEREICWNREVRGARLEGETGVNGPSMGC